MADGFPPEPPDWTPVLTVEHERGIAAVCRDPDGSFWLMHNLAWLNETDWDGDPPEEGEDWGPRDELGEEIVEHEIAGFGITVEEITALAGHLPEGAASVEVRDRSGASCPGVVANGLWLAVPDVCPGREPVVLFRDASGAPIRRQLASDASARPLDGVEVECPACDSRQWQLVVTAHDERVAACGVCGHELRLPQQISIPVAVVEASDESLADLRRQAQEHMRTVWERVVAGLGRAPVGLTGEEEDGSIVGWGEDPRSRRVTSITLEHGDDVPEGRSLDITTHAGGLDYGPPVQQWLEEHLVSALFHEWGRFEGSDEDAALVTELLRRGVVEARVHALAARQVSLTFDGRPTTFLALGDDDAWSAFAELDGISVTIKARRWRLAAVQLESARAEWYVRDA